jgi:hypothetical protein
LAGFAATRKKWVLGSSGHVILDLSDQRRHQIEGLMDVGEFVQQLDHAVVVFERMQAHPGQAVLSGDQILVERLMLMPQDNDAQNGHWSGIPWKKGSTGDLQEV